MQTSKGTTNAKFSTSDAVFRKACELANVQPTKRQASKFRRGTGRAYEHRNEARQQVNTGTQSN